MPTLTFTNGNDSYTVTAAGDYTLNFLAGDDILTVNGGTFTTAFMGEGADRATLRVGDASIFGESGNDRFEITAAGIEADGGGDDDLFNVRGGSGQSLNGGLGVDRFNFYAGALGIFIDGGDGNDDFFGYYQTITGNIHGGAGYDYFVQFRGAVTLYGGAGNDIFRADAASPATFVETVGQGTDSVQVARGASYTLPANVENISVQGFHGSTTGPAVLTGNASNNTVNGHANVETINGLGGNDRLFAKGSNDTVWGGDGNDFLDGGQGNDILNGEAGNDIINGRAGVDTMAGGAGDDTYYVDDHSDSVIENPGEGTDLIRVDTSGPFQSTALDPNVENGILTGTGDFWLFGNTLNNELTGNSNGNRIDGVQGDDIVRGGGGNDTLWGDSGNDLIQGGDGNDILFGEYGNDVVIGGIGADSMNGGPGDDTFYVDNAADIVIEEEISNGTDLVRTSVDFTLPIDIENAIAAGPGLITILGNSGDNELTGNSANSSLYGLDGNDTLTGTLGADNLRGDNGDDLIVGRDGDDNIQGGAGADTMTGGNGDDDFEYNDVGESAPGAADQITDFLSVSGPTGDKLELQFIDADTGTAGDQAFVINSTGTAAGTAADLWFTFVTNPDSTLDIIFYGDVDGDGVANFEVHVHTLTGDLFYDDIVF